MATIPTSNFTDNTSLNTQRSAVNRTARGINTNLDPSNGNTNGLLQTATNIFVYANGGLVGMIQSFQVSENRTINKLQAIGWEGVVQAVPSNTNGGQLSVTRIALYESNIWNALGLTTDAYPYNPLGSKTYSEATGNGNPKWDTATSYSDTLGQKVSSRFIFKTLKDQKVPLEIQVKTKKAGSADEYYIETYVDCWLSSYSKSYTVQTITVAETAQIQYADVY